MGWDGGIIFMNFVVFCYWFVIVFYFIFDWVDWVICVVLIVWFIVNVNGLGGGKIIVVFGIDINCFFAEDWGVGWVFIFLVFGFLEFICLGIGEGILVIINIGVWEINFYWENLYIFNFSKGIIRNIKRFCLRVWCNFFRELFWELISLFL